jgi:hypothetical protein
MKKKKPIQFGVTLCAALTILILLTNSCQRKDIVAGSDFYIDLNTGSVTDRYGAYQTNIPDYTNLYLTGGYVYIYGIIVFKGLDQSYYALSQYHSTDGCSVEYDVAYDELICPCDQFHFDKYGQETIGNGTSYLAVYGTSLSNSQLHIYTP